MSLLSDEDRASVKERVHRFMESNSDAFGQLLLTAPEKPLNKQEVQAHIKFIAAVEKMWKTLHQDFGDWGLPGPILLR